MLCPCRSALYWKAKGNLHKAMDITRDCLQRCVYMYVSHVFAHSSSHHSVMCHNSYLYLFATIFLYTHMYTHSLSLSPLTLPLSPLLSPLLSHLIQIEFRCRRQCSLQNKVSCIGLCLAQSTAVMILLSPYR